MKPDITETSGPPLWQRLAWFAAIWAASVCALAIVAAAIRELLG
jgi:hypothetical protein